MQRDLAFIFTAPAGSLPIPKRSAPVTFTHTGGSPSNNPFKDCGQGHLSTIAQYPSLRSSQSVMIGHSLILAQILTELPSPASLDPEREVGRYNWLLQGDYQACLEIHSGCGFSRKLLHMISQITYCAARMQQDPESEVIPMTADYLYEELNGMRQWSGEFRDYEAGERRPAVVDFVRAMPQVYYIDSPMIMTHVTAEAWRVATTIYLQCRVLRLPRHHPLVVAQIRHLADCFRIMPTSGNLFTAQAPLFPIYILGMLATTPYHKEVVINWFNAVIQEPGRIVWTFLNVTKILLIAGFKDVSLVQEALIRIWSWIDEEVEMHQLDGLNPNNLIGSRAAWWEVLVARIQTENEQTLCRT